MEKNKEVDIIDPLDIVDAEDDNEAYDPLNDDDDIEIIDGGFVDSEQEGEIFDPLGIDSPFAGIYASQDGEMDDFIDFLNESEQAVDDDYEGQERALNGFLTGAIFEEEADEGALGESGSIIQARPRTTMADLLMEDENIAVANRLKRIEKMCDDAFHGDGFIESIRQQLDAFLNGPECRDFPDKDLVFTSRKFKSAGTFRIMIRNVLISELNRMELGSVFNDDAYVKLNNLIDTVIREERYDFDEARVLRIRVAVSRFVKFFEGIASTVKQRPITLNTYIQQGLPLTAVERIHSTFWECPCGELVRHESLVPLAVCITDRGKREFVVVNEPVGCPNCKSILIIPEVMIKELHPKLVNIINDYNFKVNGVVFYRPKWEDVEQLIPSDWKHYFNFEQVYVDDYDQVADYSERLRGGYANLYSTLVEHWMKEVLQKSAPDLKDEAAALIASNQDVARALTLSLPLEEVFNSVEVTYDVDLDLRNYISTLIHYLENVGCFAITRESKAFYEFCERNGIKRFAFPKDRAIRWLTVNAPALVGLKNVVSSAEDFESLGILPEYVPSLNYLCMLRTLSRVENPVHDKYKSWCRSPHTKSADDFLYSLRKKENTRRPLLKLAYSERDFRDVNVTYSREAFSDLFCIVSELQMNVDLPAGYSVKLQDLASEIAFSTREEFYQLDSEEAGRKYMIQPMYRFDDFVDVFEEAGFNLFISHISDKRIIERAKVVYLMSRHLDFSKVFSIATAPKVNKNSLLRPLALSEEDYLNDLRDIILLFDERLPDELIQARELLPQDAFLKMVEEATDAFDNDTRLKEAYPEVFK